MLEIEVRAMVAIDVPNAKCIKCSAGKPCAPNSMNSSGTSTMPPPTPNRPAQNPPKMPNNG
jgi:hypothetical protein